MKSGQDFSRNYTSDHHDRNLDRGVHSRVTRGHQKKIIFLFVAHKVPEGSADGSKEWLGTTAFERRRRKRDANLATVDCYMLPNMKRVYPAATFKDDIYNVMNYVIADDIFM